MQEGEFLLRMTFNGRPGCYYYEKKAPQAYPMPQANPGGPSNYRPAPNVPQAPIVDAWSGWMIYEGQAYKKLAAPPKSYPSHFDEGSTYWSHEVPADLTDGDLLERLIDGLKQQYYKHWRRHKMSYVPPLAPEKNTTSARQSATKPKSKTVPKLGKASMPTAPTPPKPFQEAMRAPKSRGHTANAPEPKISFELESKEQVVKLKVIGTKGAIAEWKQRLNTAQVSWNPAVSRSQITILTEPAGGSVDFKGGGQWHTIKDAGKVLCDIRLKEKNLELLGENKKKQNRWLEHILSCMRKRVETDLGNGSWKWDIRFAV